MTRATKPNPKPDWTTVASLAAGERGITSPKPKVVMVVPLTYKSSMKLGPSPSGSLNDDWSDQFISAKAKVSAIPQTTNNPNNENGPKIDRKAARRFGCTARSANKQ